VSVKGWDKHDALDQVQTTLAAMLRSRSSAPTRTYGARVLNVTWRRCLTSSMAVSVSLLTGAVYRGHRSLHDSRVHRVA
jgi:hypothetical protein